MPRERWVFRDGKLTQVDPDYRGPRRNAGPFVISDAMSATRNPADGLTYDSKSAYYGSLKARGLEIDDRPMERAATERPQLDSNDRKADIARTLANYGH